MIELRNNIFMPETSSEFPDFTKCKELFLDVETKRVFDYKDHGGMYPWKGDRICGIAVTADDCSKSYYLPCRHGGNSRYNLPIELVMKWAKDHLTSANEWINHNVVFDAMMFAVGEGIVFDCKLVDTLTLSKVHDSDRFGHKLKDLGRDWLEYDTASEDELKSWLKELKTKNYADVPADRLGLYACDDVLMNRKLYRYLQEHRAEGLERTWATEIQLTPILFDMELEGLQIDPLECKLGARDSLIKMISTASIIEDIAEREWTNSSVCIYDILINQHNLPVLLTKKEKKEGRMIDTGRPSFDKEAMAMYRIHPLVTSDEKLATLVDAICEYRIESQHKGLFLDPFLALHDENNCVHPSYNQVVRTGRMSCSRPNAQQQNKRSKKLIHPRKGMGFCSFDYSQIEYRLIAHYINDQQIIDAYMNDPDVDFHQWVADLLHVKRKAGKTLNFGMAYGAGERKVTNELSANPDIIEEVSKQIEGLIKSGQMPRSEASNTFKRLCQEHSSRCYSIYHERIPGIKATAKKASSVCKYRGYIFNAYGRRRYLPENASYRAFNSIIQGCAMDIMKEGMIKLSPRYNKTSRDYGIRLAANVHDDCTIEVPIEIMRDPSLHNYVKNLLENPSVKFRIPILTGVGISDKNWSVAAGDAGAVKSSGGIITEYEDMANYKPTEGDVVMAGKVV